MEISFLDVLISCVALLLLAVPGFILVKVKMLNASAEKAFSNFVLYVSQTFMMFMCFQGKYYTPSIGINMLIVAGLTFIPYFVFAFILKFVKLKNEEKTRIFRYSSIFGNVGFMGIPFIKMLFANSPLLGDILIYVAVAITVFNLLNWTLGVYIISGDKKEMSIKKVALNPVIICIVISCVLFVTVQKPIVDLAPAGTALDGFLEKLISVFNYLSETVTPLSMTVIGMKLANVKLKQVFLDKDAYMPSVVKLVILPIFVATLVAFLPIGVELKYAIFLTASMPSATSTALYAIKYNVATEYAPVIVLLSTILSIVTIPLIFILFTGVFGVVI